MRLTDVVTRLRKHEAELRGRGIVHLSVFGSVARDEAHADSDVDLAAVLDPQAHIGLMTLADIEHRIQQILDLDVDLVIDHPEQKPRFRRELDRDRVIAF